MMMVFLPLVQEPLTRKQQIVCENQRGPMGLELRWAGLVPTGGFAPIILLGFDDTFELQPRLQVEKSAKPPGNNWKGKHSGRE